MSNSFKIVVCVRDSKGRMVKTINPMDIPADGSIPDAARLAAEAVRASMEYGPPIPVVVAKAPKSVTVRGMDFAVAVEDGSFVQPSGKGQGRRGRPAGFKCSLETRAAMSEGKRLKKLARMQEEAAEREYA